MLFSLAQVQNSSDCSILPDLLGSSKPGFFLSQDVEDFKYGMNLNYLGTLHAVKVKEAPLMYISIYNLILY
jgi:hypothetical protein